MIVRTHKRGYGDLVADPCAGLQWEAYCSCRFANDPTNRLKCKSKPWSCCPVGVCPPWADPSTDLGSGCRDIPKPGAGALYSVQRVLSTISLIDKVAVPKQMEAIATQEAVVAEQARVLQQSQIDQAHAAQVRENVLKYAQWGGIALAGVLVAAVAVRALSPKVSA